MLRMISVFVMGLLPDFFAIADSSKKRKGKWCAAEPPPRLENSAENAERERD
jgi:hypothetical protein